MTHRKIQCFSSFFKLCLHFPLDVLHQQLISFVFLFYIFSIAGARGNCVKLTCIDLIMYSGAFLQLREPPRVHAGHFYVVFAVDGICGKPNSSTRTPSLFRTLSAPGSCSTKTLEIISICNRAHFKIYRLPCPERMGP